MAKSAADQHIKFIGTTPFSYQNICKNAFVINDGLYKRVSVALSTKSSFVFKFINFYEKRNFLNSCVSIVAAWQSAIGEINVVTVYIYLHYTDLTDT